MREGLMDDVGWHKMDYEETFIENYCFECGHYNDDKNECRKHKYSLCNEAEDFVPWRELEEELRCED